MKSPLVKALRQANGDDASEQVADKLPVATDEQQPSEAGELQLMDSAQVPQVDNDISLELDDAPGIAHNELEVDFVETMTIAAEQPANEDGDVAAREFIDAPGIDASTTASHRLWIRRLGSYSPLVCVFLVLAAAGCYFGYQKLGGRNQNTDLQALPTQVRTSAVSAVDSHAGSSSQRNPFSLLVALPVASARTATTDTPRAEKPYKPRPQLVESSDPPVDDMAFAVLNEAFRAYELGDYAQAEAAYRRALVIAPRHPNALHGLAAILQRTGRFDESRQYYESLLSVEPGNTAAAAALLTGGEESLLGASESEIKQLIQRHPNSAGLQFAFGQLLAKQSRWADARNVFANAARLDDDNADYLFNLAISLEHLGLYVEARRFYESALAASDATSTLNSDIVVARIESLAAHSDAENKSQ